MNELQQHVLADQQAQSAGDGFWETTFAELTN